MPIRAVVTGIGHAAPAKILSNAELERMVDTSDEWITQRTGIKERRICEPHETASTLGTIACVEALNSAGASAEDLDMIIVGSVTGDYPFPSTACLIQHNIGATKAGAFDVGAACAGFIYSLATGTALIESGQCKRVLVVGVDILSKIVDYTDRATCVLFGDGGGAIVLEGIEGSDRGVEKTVLLADGSGQGHINLEYGGSKYPVSDPESLSRRKTMYMAGAEVYRFAVTAMGDACLRVMSELNLTSQDIDLFVPHQANLRIIQSAAQRLGLPDEKVFVNVHKYGNTSGGSIPLALYEACQEGRLKKGMRVLTVGFGAGLVWGANIIRW
jgi:3-oxoacyl-[acyl-carrier-protein] synthase-3